VTVPLSFYVAVSAGLFFIGCAGVLTRRNAVVILMCVELMLNAANLALVAFSRRFGAVDERAASSDLRLRDRRRRGRGRSGDRALAYRNRPVIDVDEIHQMKG